MPAAPPPDAHASDAAVEELAAITAACEAALSPSAALRRAAAPMALNDCNLEQDSTPAAAARCAGLGTLSALPPALLERILALLLPRSLTAAGCASAALRALAHDEATWRAAAERRAAMGMAPPAVRYCTDGSQRDVALLDFAGGSWRGAAAAGLGAPPPRACPPRNELLAALPSAYRRWALRCASLTPLQLLPEDCRAVQELDSGAGAGAFAARCDDAQLPGLLRAAASLWPLRGTTASELADAFPGAPLQTTARGGLHMTGAAFGAYLRACAASDTDGAAMDDEPLLVFDSDLGGAAIAEEVCARYAVPNAVAAGTKGDLLAEGLGETSAERPAHRWLLAAPARSGSRWRADPALSSSWHALCSGRRRWALYPPGAAPKGVTLERAPSPPGAPGGPGGAGADPAVVGPSALDWFLGVYPTLEPHERPLECIQHPGDVVWVPAGWWHCVLNLDETLAVTQSLLTEASLTAAARRSVVRYECPSARRMGQRQPFAFLREGARERWASETAARRPHLAEALHKLGLLAK